MTTTLDYEQVTEFAKAVRRELADLGPDVIDDLTDGLEADLADKLDDGAPLGDPAAYAAELRDASGLSPASRSRHLDRFRDDLVVLRSRFASLAARPAVAAVLAFLVALRPVWWIIRGWALFYILAGFTPVPQNEFDPWVLLGLVVLSVQWGRGRWLPWKWSRGAVIALSVIAALAVPAAFTAVADRLTFASRIDPDDYISDGILLNKQPITNIFAYGADGQPLTDVRLYDQYGNPFSVVPDEWDQGQFWAEDGTLLLPSERAGTEGWNVYPLEAADPDDINENGEAPTWAKRIPVQAPFASVQELLGYEAPSDDDE